MAQARERNTEALRILTLGMTIATGLLFLNARYPSMLRVSELKAFDLRMHARAERKPLGEVAIVAIDDKSIAELGRWPWPRTTLARLTQALKSYNAGVVGFDMVFSEPDDHSVSNDQTFADALAAHGTAFIGYPLEVDNDG